MNKLGGLRVAVLHPFRTGGSNVLEETVEDESEELTSSSPQMPAQDISTGQKAVGSSTNRSSRSRFGSLPMLPKFSDEYIRTSFNRAKDDSIEFFESIATKFTGS